MKSNLSKMVLLAIVLTLAMSLLACSKNNDEKKIKAFLDIYYENINIVGSEKANFDEMIDLIDKGKSENDKLNAYYGDLSKITDMTELKKLMLDRQFMSPVYNDKGYKKAEIKVNKIEKDQETNSYNVDYDIKLSGVDDYKENHKVRLAVEGEKVIIKNGSIGPTAEVIYGTT
ncbi:MAG: hypothetical protein MR314_06500 [Ezakiella sp.]|nr:hypothetical protein [Ezakiella sp.]